MLRTNIELDEKVVAEAMRLARVGTKKEIVNVALKELVKKLKRRKLLELAGKVAWSGNLDEMRKRRA